MVAACIVKGGVPGIGLAQGNVFTDANSYPAFVPVNWKAVTSLRVRRTNEGAEIIEVNGVAPVTRQFVDRVGLPTRHRVDPTVEFGCPSVEAEVSVSIHAFRTERAVTAAQEIFDPVPDPTQAQWTKEGPGAFTPGSPLIVDDGGAGAGQFCNFFTPADFATEQLLTPRLTIDPGFVEDPSDGNTGVHVSFNDGVGNKIARAVLLKAGANQVRVAVAKAGGYSTGFTFPGLVADFVFRRKTDGSVTLQALGQPEEPTDAGELPVAQRPNARTIEFGTYDVPADTDTRWETLGLPKVGDFPVGIKFDELRIRDVDTNDSLRLRCELTLAANSDGIDPATENVTLKFTATDGAVIYQTAALTGFAVQGKVGQRRWALSDSLRVSTGIERFIIHERTDGTRATVAFVDRHMNIPPFPMTSPGQASINVEIAVGNDRGAGDANLIEHPIGIGSWHLV